MHRVISSYFIYTILSSTLFWVIIESLIGEKVRIAEVGEFPFVVSIDRKNPQRNAQQNQFCTGIVISRMHILTTAHCLVNTTLAPLVNQSNIQVTIGSVDLWNGRNYDVKTWITYNEWARIFNKPLYFDFNDIAILQLSRGIAERHVRPVILSSLNYKHVVRSQAIIAGFGITESGESSRFLLAANVNILSSEECNSKFYTITNVVTTIPENELCSTAEPHALLGLGDSGGPILNLQKQLVGINMAICPLYSWYQECGSEEFLKKYKMNTHLNIDLYRSFIEIFQ